MHGAVALAGMKDQALIEAVLTDWRSAPVNAAIRATLSFLETLTLRPDEVPAEAADLSDGLARLIADVERELGSPLAELPRAGKQRAVRLLEERGAFEMRRSAETVAEALGVTRFTVYNYLNRNRDEPAT